MAESKSKARIKAAEAAAEDDGSDTVQGDPQTDTQDAPGIDEVQDEADRAQQVREQVVTDELVARVMEDNHAPASPIQQGTAVRLDATVAPDEDSIVKLPEQQSDEPCDEHYPDGWATVGFEPGARLSCEHGSWAYGETPSTRPQNHTPQRPSEIRCPHCGRLIDEEADRIERGEQ